MNSTVFCNQSALMGVLCNAQWFNRRAGLVMWSVATSIFLPVEARAVTVPFVEEFVVDSANWRNNDSTTPLGWSATGDPMGSSYAFATFNFVNSTANATPAIYRAHASFDSSSGAFVGSWISDVSVSGFQLFVRHNTGVPLTFFVRFAEPDNFPGAVSVVSPPVPSGQWTGINIPIPDPNFVFEQPGQTFVDLFDNIGNLQIGVIVPSSLAGVDQTYTFDIDKVALSTDIPTVSEWGMLVMAMLVLTAATLLLRGRESGGSFHTVAAS